MSLEQICQKIPKIELHAHLNGSLSEATLKQLNCSNTSISEYQKLSKIFQKTSRTLEECFELFKVAQKVTNNIDSVFIATENVIKEFFLDNVIYLELRTTPRAEENMTKEQYIEAVVQAIEKNTNSIIVKLILSIDRRHDKKTSREALDIIIKMKNKYPNVIKGIDLSGNPALGEFDEELFAKAKRNGLLTAIHCAEIKNDEEVKKILKFRPHRIGHATFLHPEHGGCQENWEVYKKLKIPIECCITSNVVCGISKSYKEHHIQEWIKGDLPFSICTDDKGVFCTTSSEEYVHVSRNFFLTVKDLLQISYKSIDFSFASNEEKSSLKKSVNDWEHKNKTLLD